MLTTSSYSTESSPSDVRSILPPPSELKQCHRELRAIMLQQVPLTSLRRPSKTRWHARRNHSRVSTTRDNRSLSPQLRAYVTSDIKIMQFSGHKYQTNPVTYLPGEFTMWRYANDILKGVEIQSVFLSSSLIPTYRYSFKIVTDETMMHNT